MKKAPRKITRKQKLMVFVAAGALALGFGGRYLVGELHARLMELQQKIKVAEKQLEKGLRVQENKEKIAEDLKKYEPYFKVPPGNEKQRFAELLKDVERLVHSLNGTIVNLTPQDAPEVEKAYKEYRASFRIEMGFSQFLQLLSEVQEGQRLLRFKKLTITSQGDQANVLRVEGEIALAVLK